MEVKELNQYSSLCPILFEIITLLELPYLKKRSLLEPESKV